jgi:tetratricopeptide (TPR) repeat protein
VGGVWGWAAWDWAARRAAAERAADVAFGKAQQAAEQARRIEQSADEAAKVEPETPEAAKQALAFWRQADDAVDEAERALAAAFGEEEARGRLAARREEVEAGLRRAEKEARLLEGLDRAHFLHSNSRGGDYDYESAAGAYTAVVEAYGLDASGPEAETAAAIRKERPAVRLALVVALDDWAYCFLGPEQARLLRIADAADDDGWRRRCRAAATAGDLDELKRLADEARGLDLPAVSIDRLGRALSKLEARAEAADLLRQARHRHPTDFWIHFDLRCCLGGDPDHPDPATLDEAVGSGWAAVALRPGSAPAHNNLGLALKAKGDLDGAVACYHKALHLDPKLALAHTNLGAALAAKRDLGGAVACYKKALDLDPKLAPAHANLGAALAAKGDLDRAVACYKKALDLDPKYALAHYNLGNALYAQGKREGAEREYREALCLWPDFPEAHCNLGHLLRDQGRFAEARAELRRGHELGARDPKWRYPSGRWVKECERLAELDAESPAVLRGAAEPADADAALGFAQVCRLTKRHAAAARLSAEAFEADPTRADDLLAGARYNAACSAALAGCGRGADAPADEAERGRLRAQALAWLRADLARWGERDDAKAGSDVRGALRGWRDDPQLAGVRDPDALEKLPEAERVAWLSLWADADALLRKAAPP